MRIEPIKLMPVGSRLTSDAVLPTSGDKSFGQLLSDALNNVNELQKSANQASVDLAAGKLQDVSQVVIATEKASVALQLTMQVRNKIVDAYQEVMRMQV
ncbi:flagellar hook-basal body complex protein FliE [Propionispora hippei]|uniref:Flagellar hook-basal body complex protein FliE n=1 Tax=Propionispora hippei DSM 15287 TaxID=1123003 RepID=A0A1M6D1Q8_9FIRM|nr:flagellar hook-basal body complex protein FliE [Propionispora hippei]SHI67197.1 flagellar hook-basal body complex protein FliE [Propionispora hippei DSM 15287]